MDSITLFGTAILTALSTWFNGSITSLGIVTLVFAVIERTRMDFKPEPDDWDPSSLAPLPQSANRIKKGDLVAAVVFNLIAIILLNLFYGLIGIYNKSNGAWTMTPFLTDAFKTWTPYLTILWSAEIILNVFVLQAGSWGKVTHWLAFAHAMLWIGLLAAILNGPAIVVPAGQLLPNLAEPGQTGIESVIFHDLLNNALRLGLAVAIIVEVVELAMQVRSLLRRRND